MYSTANDMTRWLEYLLDLPGVPIHQDPAATATYIQASQLRWTQGLAHAGVPSGIGLGWVHINQPDDPTTIIEKTGGGAGFATYIALNPEHHIGIFVAATDGRHEGANIFRESNDLLVYLSGLTPAPGNSMELAANENRSDVQVREVTLHKHQQNAARTRLARQIKRTSVIAAVQ
jgi:D-alanyl-D-alanine-carboxypeptidase/D-alanyl-D-alanine-endopeptidase